MDSLALNSALHGPLIKPVSVPADLLPGSLQCSKLERPNDHSLDTRLEEKDLHPCSCVEMAGSRDIK